MNQFSAPWPEPPDNLILATNDVHVWRLPLTQPAEVRQQLAAFLDPDERDRASRFHFEKDRHHYTVGRGVLRILLGRYLGLSPAAIKFRYGQQSKPALTNDAAPFDLRFNLSHSHGEALLAFSHGRELGVDIEQIRHLNDAESIATHYFSAQDIATFLALPPEQRDEGFFNCWTRKEAYIKAIGEGLSHPLDTFDVSLTPGQPAQLLAVRSDPNELARWQLIDLKPVPGYAAAIIVEGEDFRLHCWDFGPEPGFNRFFER